MLSCPPAGDSHELLGDLGLIAVCILCYFSGLLWALLKALLSEQALQTSQNKYASLPNKADQAALLECASTDAQSLRDPAKPFLYQLFSEIVSDSMRATLSP